MQDLRFGLRVLAKSPGFTLVAVVTLALGIGATAAIFSVVNTVLLRPLPYRDPDQLVMVWETAPQYGFPRNTPAPANYFDWRDQSTVFESMAAISDRSFNLTGAGEPERVDGRRVSASLFPLLGVEVALGRTFVAEEDREGARRVVVLSHGLWQRRFGGDPQLIGKTIALDGESYHVVGVMPAGFQFLGREDQLWVPIAFSQREASNRSSHYLSVVARIKSGVTREQAQAEMETIARRLEQQYPRTNSGIGANVISLREQLVGDLRPALLVLLGAVAFVLAVACANVANLMLARAATRSTEIAIRIALGAGRGRIIRQLLTESLLLAALGGLAGLLLAFWGLRLLTTLVPEDLTRVQGISMDARALGFTMLISLLTGVLFGLAPAWQATRSRLHETLKEGGRGSGEGIRRNRLRSALVVSEVALALVLLLGAGLMIKSFLGLLRVNSGLNPAGLLTVRVELPPTKYARSEQRAAFYDLLLERVRRLPGVQTAGMISWLPLTFGGGSNILTVESRPPVATGQEPLAVLRVVTPGYFRTLGVPLLRGRVFEPQDGPQALRVVVVNQALARRLWPGEDAIGKRFKQGYAESSYPWLTVVGVVGDVRQFELDQEPKPEMYLPHLQSHESWVAPRDLAVRTASDPLDLAAAVRREVWAIDPDQPISDVQTMEQILSRSVAPQRFNMLLLGIFAAVALALAGVGIYGVMSYSISQRTREIGIRIALGAQGRDVIRLVVGQAALLTLVGVGLGLIAALALTRLMASLLYGVGATDPMTFAAVPLLLFAVALIACYLPARRATKVDPMVALRYE